MTNDSRTNAYSTVTAIKGSLVNETYTVFAGWDFSHSKRENLDRMRERNLVGAKSAAWLSEVAKALHCRFDPEGFDRPLVVLAQRGLPIDEWKPLLLWHITRNDPLVRDFLENWLFDAYDRGTLRIYTEDVEKYLVDKTAARAWSAQTTKRVATGLLKLAVDLGLLRGRASRRFVSYHLSDRSFLYLLHAMNDENMAPSSILSSPAWRMFLMSPADVESRILHLHQYRVLEYHAAGSIVQLSLPYKSACEYAEKVII